MHIRTVAAALISAVAAVTLSPVAASATTVNAPTCRPTDPTGAPVQVGVADDMRTVCLLRGQILTVQLSVDPNERPNPVDWWTPITATGTALTRLPMIELVRRGVTLARFRATEPGTSELMSTVSVCPHIPGKLSCAAIREWQLTARVTPSGPWQ